MSNFNYKNTAYAKTEQTLNDQEKVSLLNTNYILSKLIKNMESNQCGTVICYANKSENEQETIKFVFGLTQIQQLQNWITKLLVSESIEFWGFDKEKEEKL